MAITLPQPGNDLDAIGFGQPVATQLNALVPTVWYNVVFTNSWSNAGGTWQTVQYRKIGDIVYIRGYMGAGGLANQPAFTLPVGFRPPKDLALDTDTFAGGNMHASVLILISGAVQPSLSGSTGVNFEFSTIA